MYKIAILGCENSHADAFIKLTKTEKYSDIEVVGVYTDDETANARMRDNYGVYTAASYDEFVGKVDGIMITARHGDNHMKYALPYLESGVPMFIDKPATASVDDARAFADLLGKHGIRYSGGSSCIHTPELRGLIARVESGENGKLLGGSLRAPISLTNPYGDFWFYAQHLVQIMQETFGYYPDSVKAYKREGQVNCIYRYPDFDVYAEFVDGNYLYHVSADTERAVIHTDISVTEAIFEYEFDEYVKVLKGGSSPYTPSDFFAPVFVIDATIRAIASGNEEKIGRL